MKDHIPTIAALIALALVLTTIATLVFVGKPPGEMLYGAALALCGGLTPSFSPRTKPEPKEPTS
jgi:hypothetical protein